MKNYANYKKQNKLIVFSDMQKGCAIAMMLFFFVIFLFEFAYPLVSWISGPFDGV